MRVYIFKTTQLNHVWYFSFSDAFFSDRGPFRIILINIIVCMYGWVLVRKLGVVIEMSKYHLNREFNYLRVKYRI